MATYDTMDYFHLLKGQRALVVNCESEIETAVKDLFTAHGAEVRLIRTLEELEGEQAADILVCGMLRPKGLLFHRQSRDAVSEYAFRSVQMLERSVHSVLEHMMAQCNGKIVAVLSEYGSYSVPMRSIEGCGAQAMNGLICALAMDYCKFNIRANCVQIPFQLGQVGAEQMAQQSISPEDALDLQLLRRLPVAEDVAKAVLFLASDMSSFISGETVPVNGGGFNIGHNQTWDRWLNHVI